MRRCCLVFLLIVIALMPTAAFSGDILLGASDITSFLIKADTVIAAKYSKKGIAYKRVFDKYKDYCVLLITLKNISSKITPINPNHFTVISDTKHSSSYSSKTYSIQNAATWLKEKPLDHVRLLPGTIARGYLLFQLQNGEHKSDLLYFDNGHFSKLAKISHKKIKGKKPNKK